MIPGLNYECAVLIATKDRWGLLTQRALPSILSQTRPPTFIVLVNDGKIFEERDMLAIRKMSGTVPIEVMSNRRSPGAAGAWNTGLGYLREIDFDGFVAILDDDDEWDNEHIALNLSKARETGAELVVSGLRRVASGQVKPRALPADLKDSDFLCGNPGLQGSNTFVSLRAMEQAGNFTEGLPSLNDRDLAVRLLRTSVQVAYTNQWTATWHHGVGRQTLSSPRSLAKILGLQWFWRRYSGEMSEDEQVAYLERAYKCFGVTRKEVEDNWGVDKIGRNGTSKMVGSFKRNSTYPAKWLMFGRLGYGLRFRYRKLRISKPVTRILGPQYKRSRNLIEIDITYLCNLHCLNCNRSTSQAPEEMHITLERIQSFVADSIARRHQWKRIRVLGGEPTLHPRFQEIIDCLLRYCEWNTNCQIEVVTNGYGEKVQSVLKTLPPKIWIENSRKSGQVQEDFGPFNLAPCDDPSFSQVDYRNGCAIMEECGMGLTPMGYYPCAIAGGIDRIAGWGIGNDELPSQDNDMLELLERACALCGRFQAGHFIPKNLRPKVREAMVSASWETLYEKWASRSRALK